MFTKLVTRYGLVGLASMTLISCGGGEISLDEAQELTLNYQGANYTPPPRGVDTIIAEIKGADESEDRAHVCRSCDDLALEGVKPPESFET